MAKVRKNSARKNKQQIKTRRVAVGNIGGAPNLGWDRQSLVIFGGIVVAVIVVVFAVHFGKVAKDRSRFHWAEQRISYARDRLSQVAGIDVSSKWENTCINTSEQMFSSTMECTTQLGASYTVSSQGQASSVEANINKLMASPKVFESVVTNIAGNMEPSTAPVDNPQFNVPSKGLYCNWSFSPESSDVKDEIRTLVYFTVSCTAPAAGDIYSN